jgi:hypothetical protein
VASEQPATYVVGDVHGHRAVLTDALRDARLIDETGDWAAGMARLWFLGDFVDRGPDGVGVIDLVIRLARQAAHVGGEVQTLLGNHEVLLLGMRRFGDAEVPSGFGRRSFERSWTLNGGQASDLDALTDDHVEWLASRPAIAHASDHLLLHSDTLEYFTWGSSVDEINDSVREVLVGDDLSEWWEVWRRMTTRYAFRGTDGPEIADMVLERLGGSRIVHGHSVIADQLGVHPMDIEAPLLYAGDRVLGVDGGVFAGGPCLVVPLWPPTG